MGRELDGYRENLEILNTRFPNHEMLIAQEVMQVTGFSDRRTVINKVCPDKWVDRRLSKVFLARYMCG